MTNLVVNAIEPQLHPHPDRFPVGIWQPGVLDADSFEVTAPGGMFVRVGSGTPGDRAVVGGVNRSAGRYGIILPDGFYDAPGDLPISPGDPSNDRIDLVVLRIMENFFDASGQTMALVTVREGNPSSSPSAPTPAANEIPLCEVEVGQGESTAIGGGDLTDVRQLAQVRGTGATPEDDDDLVPLGHMRDYVDAGPGIQTYTPTLTASTTNPTKQQAGSGGSQTGRFQVIGGICYVWVRYTMGAGGTRGSGSYMAALPLPIDTSAVDGSGGVNAGSAVGAGAIRSDADSMARIGVIVTLSDVQQVRFLRSDEATAIQHNQPAPWDNGDVFSWHASYPVDPTAL